MPRLFYCSLLVVGLLLSPAALAQPAHPLKVKELTERMGGSNPLEGVVKTIDKDGLVLLETVNKPEVWLTRKRPPMPDPPVPAAGAKPEVKEHKLVPIDLLRDGGVLPKVFGMYAYRWQDVKAGDTVMLRVMEDEADKVVYCTEVCISRRPGEKLPLSQDPKTDQRYAGARIFNDIENGEDVSDEEIAKAFPPEFYRDPKTGLRVPFPASKNPPGLKYMEKLAAIREKKQKEQDLKATPPDKKK